MNPIKFKNSRAQAAYNDYIQRCKKAVKTLPEKDSEDCLSEINSYIYEFLNENKGTDEMQGVSEILGRLGKPGDILKEAVASKKMAQATKTLNPVHLVQALVLNARKGVTYTVVSGLILILLCLPVLLVFKFIYPKHVGFFTGGDGFLFGFTSLTGNRSELLGYWFLPIVFFISMILYFGIIFLLKSVRTPSKTT